ncbi:secretion protein (plasmid) [Mycobacterium adipatum]|uniref:Secretion protein n=1 Tax=Mycobacterium adipatum TaxID=1682113 RepID=A0A172UWT6_9MYCO|nr:ESX secretion-associated protein EspG [Mycobacterium adipatum]ANE83542.1 secretion protein [Mycobacterium adipatum]
MTSYDAVEVTAHQAWFLADHLGAGTYPWKLAITAPYVDPGEREPFNERCLTELTEIGVIDEQGRVKPSVAESIRTICQATQWLEWFTMIDPDQILRGVLARISGPEVVVALRYAQMITFTPLQLTHSEAIVPIISAGLPQDQPPARFAEFELRMDVGKQIDERIGRGADIIETLTDLGVPERDAEVMELARTGERITVELTAHDAINGARHQTDVCVNLISTEVGLILVSPPAGEPREGGSSIFAPAEPFAISMAVRDLTDRLPSGTWFPSENYDI